MARQRRWRRVDGVLLLDKPAGVTSNYALQGARRIYQAEKAGHTGNLDPMATGLLPLLFGDATKFAQLLLDSDKRYLATIRLGVTTNTGDADGEVLQTRPVDVSESEVDRALAGLLGEIDQVPPMFAAIKHQGRPLYYYARQGQEVERQARRVTIYRLERIAFDGTDLVVDVSCSKGTYVRTLAEDLGEALGCGGHLVGLRRLESGGFSVADAHTLEYLDSLEEGPLMDCLLPVDCLLEGYPRVDVDGELSHYLRQGQAVWRARLEEHGLVRIYEDSGVFVGLGEVMDDGKLAPRRLLRPEATKHGEPEQTQVK